MMKRPPINKEIVLEIVDGIRIAVPDSLNLITTYVLREQRDWFEDEIKFVRHLLEPGQHAIDIGANYGVFTLSMAQAVGPNGRIWAFEPASTTFEFLSKSVAINESRQVVLDQRGLSFEEGSVELMLNENSELNEIVRDDSVTGTTETIRITSLDHLMKEYDWAKVDFIKIDAEGEEARIIAGGQGFFSGNSPLVQYEVKAGETLHFELVQAFNEIGYSSYRLVPGLNLLTPFIPDEPADGYLLNLFCCKADRASKLAARGLLIRSEQIPAGSSEMLSEDLLQRWNNDGRFAWQKALAQLPYGRLMATRWQQTTEKKQSSVVERALALYSISMSGNVPTADRYLALRESFNILNTLCTSQPEHLRLASLARVARDFGARVVATKALGRAVDQAMKSRKVDFSEPFLAASKRFDGIPPGQAMGNWGMGSILEALEQNAYFSSFYAGPSCRQRLQLIIELGFGSEEMKRRFDLVNRRFFSAPR
jgi:protein O-GlcNAc transferase